MNKILLLLSIVGTKTVNCEERGFQQTTGVAGRTLRGSIRQNCCGIPRYSFVQTAPLGYLYCSLCSETYKDFTLLDIPADDTVFDVNEVINLDPTKIKPETTGRQIVQQIQEWLLTKAGSSETAVLPEDKTQRLLVGVCKFELFLTFHC